MQALVGNGSPAIKPPDQETLKGSSLHRLTTSSDNAIHVERVTMIAFCDYSTWESYFSTCPTQGSLSADTHTLYVNQPVTFGCDV